MSLFGTHGILASRVSNSYSMGQENNDHIFVTVSHRSVDKVQLAQSSADAN